MFWGVLKVFAGLLAVASSLFGMIQVVPGSPENWWGPVTLSAGALLALEGSSQLFSGLSSHVLIATAAIIPIGIAAMFQDWRPRVWVFAATLAFVEWSIRRLSSASGRSEIGTFVFTGVLSAALAKTSVELFQYYWNAPSFWSLSQIFGFMFPIALPWILVLVLLAHSGREVFASPVAASR
jgi:hypothetical protein